MPKVSVIIPNFNHAPYLTQRIESILAQTYQDYEILFLDDCSTDDSKKIIDQYTNHPKVSHIIYNKENSGSTFKQWKKGVELSSGKYIWIAESDDWCEPTLLEVLVEGIEKDHDCVISYCQSYCLNNDYKIRFQSSHPSLSEIVDGNIYIQDYLSVPVSIFNASMALWKKDKFQFVPEELTSFRFCGDWYFWIQLCKHGKVHISGKLLNYFRKHDNDVSGRAYKSGLNFIEELKVINMLYSEGLISEKKHYKAYKKKFIDFWQVKDQIEGKNKVVIEEIFRHSLSSKTSVAKLTPIAIWKKLKFDWKNRKR